jgi:hypothetical protein
MNLRSIALTGTLLGLAIGSLNVFRNSGGSASPAGDTAVSVRGSAFEEPSVPRNLNQQWAGWTFGRMIGVSIRPEHAPPPTMYVWK